MFTDPKKCVEDASFGRYFSAASDHHLLADMLALGYGDCVDRRDELEFSLVTDPTAVTGVVARNIVR